MQFHGFPPSQPLVEAFADWFRGVPQPLEHGVIVPTRRLATTLQAFLAQNEIVLGPKFYIFSEFFAHEDKDCLSQLDLVLFLTEALKQTPELVRYIGRSHLHELLQLFSELDAFGLQESGPEELITVIRQDVYRSPEATDSMLERIEAVCQLYATYRQGFHGKLPISCRRADTVTVPLLREDELHLVGFTSILPSYLSALRNLDERGTLHFWYGMPRDPEAPIWQITAKLGGPEAELPQKAGDESAHICCVEAGSLIEEVDYVLSEVVKFLDQGVPASHLGILVTDEGLYGGILRHAYKQLGLEVNDACALPVRSSGFGRWLDGLLSFFASDPEFWVWHWLICHPWNRKIFPQLVRATELKPLYECWHMGAESIDIVEEIHLEHRHLTRSLRGWSEQIDRWTDLLEDDLDQEDHLAIDTFNSLLRTQTILEEQIFSPREFRELYQEVIAGEPLHQIGEPLSGVQIINISEARYVPFSHCFILGCFEGCFPKALPNDSLINDYLKRRIGLPGWGGLKAMEAQTYAIVTSSASRCYLSRPLQVDGTHVVRSSFMEQALAEGSQLVRARVCQPVAARNPRPVDSKEGAWPTLADLSAQSATSLTNLLRCPYRYLMRKEGVKKIMLPGPESRPLLQGIWLHDIVERVQRSMRDWPDRLGEALEQMLREALVGHLQGKLPEYIDHKTKQQLLHHSFPALAAHWKKLRDLMDWQSFSHPLVESDFRTKATTTGGSSELGMIFGTIDQLYRLPFATLITDFKRNRLQRPADLDLEPQLGMYALGASEHLTQTIVGHWSLLSGSWLPVAVGSEVRPKAVEVGLATRHTADLQSWVTSFTQIWQARKEQLAKGCYPADTSACEPCDYEGLCRKSDPRHQLRLSTQTWLTEYRRQNPSE